MKTAQLGDTVKVDYVGILDDGTVFESTVQRRPLQFTLGTGQVIPGFEEAVIGMSPGKEKTCRIPAEKAFGLPRKRAALVVDRDQIPEEVSPRLGDAVEIRSQCGPTAVGTVANVSESNVTLDMNHPLAGQDLTIAMRLIEIVDSFVG